MYVDSFGKNLEIQWTLENEGNEALNPFYSKIQ